MTALIENIRRIPSTILSVMPKRPVIPYISIKGQISSQTVYEVKQMLKSLPKQSKKLALIINSAGGQMSQTLMISHKIKQKAKQQNLQLITFAEQYALNSAFYLLEQGDKVYADTTTFIGGTQIGIQKVNLGFFAKYLDRVVYTNDQKTFVGQIQKNEPINPQKLQQMKQLAQYFSQNLKNQIMEKRKSISSQTDFSKFYYGQQALKLGLIDSLGRIHSIISNDVTIQPLKPKISLAAKLSKMSKGLYQINI